jgi:tetratricopeptide (TPR) repeat protein
MAQRVPASVREEKAAKGAELYKVAMQAQKMGRFNEAASSMRLAVAFDPFNRDYKRVLSEVRAKIAFEHIEEMLSEPNGVLTDGDRGEASRLAGEILLHGKGDAATCDLAARVYLKIEDADRAEEYINRAIEIDPDVSSYQRTLAGVHKLRGNNGHAMFVLQKALELDSGDVEAKQMLDALKIKPRRMSANGG